MAQEEGDWGLEGIPRAFWPHVRDILVAREIYNLVGRVSDKAVGQSLAKTAENLLHTGARQLVEAAQTAHKA
ncbi:MAG TPA: hypothetical protein VGK45_01795 [Thermoanaerobaculia bacterium]